MFENVAGSWLDMGNKLLNSHSSSNYVGFINSSCFYYKAYVELHTKFLFGKPERNFVFGRFYC